MNGRIVESRRRLGAFLGALAALSFLFCVPLHRLAEFSFHSILYSYIPLVPLICLGMVLMRLGDLPAASAPDRKMCILLALAGAAVLAEAWLQRRSGTESQGQGLLTMTSTAFALFVAAISAWFWGRPVLRWAAFPLGFLFLIAPFPERLTDFAESALQHASAATANAFFELSGTPVFRNGDLAFQLPGIRLQVAPECSGLHSTLALAITSLPAGYFFLRSPWKRAVLSLAAFPLGILRNGFRIFTIGELCVHIGPQMFNSYIHRSGGWIFFIISLGLFFPFLILLVRSERPAATTLPPSLAP
jgi:exosortase C (VPDSG-CTERM-specific)